MNPIILTAGTTAVIAATTYATCSEPRRENPQDLKLQNVSYVTKRSKHHHHHQFGDNAEMLLVI